MSSEDPQNASSTLFRGSSIVTLNPNQPEASGVLVENGAVTHLLSSEREVKQAASKEDIHTVDRPGACLLPGFADAHVHLKWVGEQLRDLDLTDHERYSAVRDTLVYHVRETNHDHDEWIHGRGWDPNRMEEERWPHWKDLDHPDLNDRPITLASHDHHTYWLNRTALERLGITSSSTSPEGGTIVKDEQGQPTGVLKEEAADPVRKRLDEQQEDVSTEDLVSRALRTAVKNGITCVHDIGGFDSLEAHLRLRDRESSLPTVCFFCFREDWNTIIDQSFDPGSLRPGLFLAGLKLFADGTLGSQTAAMFSPYDQQLDGQHTRGTLVNDRDTLRQHSEHAAQHGFTTAIHAIGDRAVHVSLDVLEETYENAPSPAYAPRIEHAQLVDPEDMSRFAEHNITASMQPCHLFQDLPIARDVWGEKRTERAVPVSALHQSGAEVLFGTDAPIESLNPLRNLQAAVHRKNMVGPPGTSDQTISIENALLLSCWKPVRYVKQSNLRGNIQPGTLANFVLLSSDPRTVAPDRLSDIDVLETYINGQRVFSSENT